MSYQKIFWNLLAKKFVLLVEKIGFIKLIWYAYVNADWSDSRQLRTQEAEIFCPFKQVIAQNL